MSSTDASSPALTTGFAGDVLRLALPIAAQNLVSALVNLLATVMVGGLGSVSLAAVGLGNQIFFLLNLFVFGVATGGGVFIAQYWGKRDVAGLQRSFGFSLAIGLVAGFLFTIAALAFPETLLGIYSSDRDVIRLGADYLRAVAWSYLPFCASFILGLAMRSVERVRPPLVATAVSLLLNVVLSYALIFGAAGFPALGIVGAGWATVAARIVELALLSMLAATGRVPLLGSLRRLMDWGQGWPSRYLRVAWPVVLNEVTWSLGITLYSAFFARVGTGAVAAYNIANTASQLAMVLFFGIANAAAVMIGKKIGEGRRDVAIAWARRFAFVSPLIGVFVAVLLLPYRAALPWLYPFEAEIITSANLMIFVLAAILPFKIFNLTLVVGICRAGGDTKFGMYYDLLGVWGLGVPLAAFGAFAWDFPAWAVFLMTATDDFAKAFLGIWRLLSGRWVRDVTS